MFTTEVNVMIRYFLDTEFVEDGRSIELISIGIVSSDGREYYAVNEEINDGEVHGRIRRHGWLMEHVVPHLPLVPGTYRPVAARSPNAGDPVGRFGLELGHPDVKRHQWIAAEVRDFLLAPGEPMELWTYYGAYDHVVMSWLWGPMVNRAKGIPMFSHDLMQLASSLGLDDSTFPKQEGALHNALEDARWTKQAWEYLTGYARRHFRLEMADDA
jgi:hypothetical protein